jgi:hypothetical protein
MEHLMERMKEAQLQKASRKKRAWKSRKRREKRRRKKVALAEESRAIGSCKEPADQLVISEAWEPMPDQEPERQRT